MNARVVCITAIVFMRTANAIVAQETVATDRRVHPVDARLASALLSRRVSVTLKGVSLAQAIDAVVSKAGVIVSYEAEVVEGVHKTVTLRLNNTTLGDALDRVLAGTSLAAVPVTAGKIAIVGTAAGDMTARQGVIVGKVTDAATKRPISGVTVVVDEAARGIQTAEDGSFRFAGVSVGRHTVMARLLGYRKQTVMVTVPEGEMVMAELTLSQSAAALDQVVVTGTIIPTELKAVPNAITVITAKQIEERGITHIDQLFRGDVPGLFAQNQGSNALLDEVTMFSRGATALELFEPGTSKRTNFTNPIKTYVDGVELADPKYLSQIDPKSIERIEILTGPQASTIYGSNAINGVMQIFTKRGTTSTPQLTLNLLSGWVENNFSSAHTPQHDYSAQLNGIEGRMSYSAGSAWNYIGPWTPAKQSTRVGGVGGARLDLPTPVGKVTADVTLRRNITQSLAHGDNRQAMTGYQETGLWTTTSSSGRYGPTTYTLIGQTLGVTLAYTPVPWWSHELGWGTDASDTEKRITARGYAYDGDTTLQFFQSHATRSSLRYATTIRFPVTTLIHTTVTGGADAWKNLASSMTALPQTLTGTLTNVTDVSRQPGHNTGGFLQTQIAFRDQLFATYGLRAEWNPGFGAEANPNYAPRYGLAYTQEIGPVTTKLRGSYGRSTHPPQSTLRANIPGTVYWGSSWPSIMRLYGVNGGYDYLLANPGLGPEHQQGGEGGLELYLGNRGSLVITRYNQMVDGLISTATVDSIDLAPAWQAVYGSGRYWLKQKQHLNLASIRNQGWELQGSLNMGLLMTRGTYSWTKSRTIGVNPKYRAQFANNPQYQPGATFQFLPEHTWAFGLTYAMATSNIALNVTGTGRATNITDDFYFRNFASNIRLLQNQLNVSGAGSYVASNAGYALADLIVSHRFWSRMEGILQIQNLANRYTNDYDASYASLGRQVKAGVRMRTL